MVNGRLQEILRLILLATAMFAAAPKAALPQDSAPRIVALGDSLVAGYGLSPEEGLVAQLQAWLRRRGRDVQILNGGVSGDTTAGGRARIDWSVGDDTDGVILALGANDMLRGLPPAGAQANLEHMLARLQERGLPTLLVGMRASANLGPGYRAEFDSIYPALAARFGLTLYPFLLEGVALEPELNQSDGIHPNAAGVKAIVERFGPLVDAWLAAEGIGGRQGDGD